MLFKINIIYSANTQNRYEHKLQATLAIIALVHDIFNQYFKITTSIIVTNNSQTIVYTIVLDINVGRINHKKGRVILEANIQKRISLIFDILLSFQKSLARRNKIIVSIIIVRIQAIKNNFRISIPSSELIISFMFMLLETLSTNSSV